MITAICLPACLPAGEWTHHNAARKYTSVLGDFLPDRVHASLGWLLRFSTVGLTFREFQHGGLFAAVGFLTESLPLQVFCQRVCRCRFSNLPLWYFHQRIAAVSSSPKNLPWSTSLESGHTRDSVGWMVCQCRRHLQEFTTAEDRLPIGEGSHCSGVPLSISRRMTPVEENADCQGEGPGQVSKFCC